MPHIDDAIKYLEDLSKDDWRALHRKAKSCPEIAYCTRSCGRPCAVASILAAADGRPDRRKVKRYLECLTNDQRDELASRPLYCLEQGFCALYCPSPCPLGRLLRLIVGNGKTGR